MKLGWQPQPRRNLSTPAATARLRLLGDGLRHRAAAGWPDGSHVRCTDINTPSHISGLLLLIIQNVHTRAIIIHTYIHKHTQVQIHIYINISSLYSNKTWHQPHYNVVWSTYTQTPLQPPESKMHKRRRYEMDSTDPSRTQNRTSYTITSYQAYTHTQYTHTTHPHINKRPRVHTHIYIHTRLSVVSQCLLLTFPYLFWYNLQRMIWSCILDLCLSHMRMGNKRGESTNPWGTELFVVVYKIALQSVRQLEIHFPLDQLFPVYAFSTL